MNRRKLIVNSTSTDNQKPIVVSAKTITSPIIPKTVSERNQDEETDELTNLLAIQSSQLLQQTAQFQLSLQPGLRQLEVLENTIDLNRTRMKGERDTIKGISSSGWSTTFLIWGGLGSAMVIFAWMVLLMRIVSPRRSLPVIIQPNQVHHTHQHIPNFIDE